MFNLLLSPTPPRFSPEDRWEVYIHVGVEPRVDVEVALACDLNPFLVPIILAILEKDGLIVCHSEKYGEWRLNNDAA